MKIMIFLISGGLKKGVVFGEVFCLQPEKYEGGSFRPDK